MMKEIVLIEDSLEDTNAVRSLLQTLDSNTEISFQHISSLEASKKYFLSHSPDLVILDLEFTKENTTSLDILSADLANVPVIILSHLSHYQYSLIQQVDIKAFIRKENMSYYLIPAIRKVLFPSRSAEPLMVTFPTPKVHGVDESVPISTIRFLEKVGKREYHLYRTDGRITSIYSVGIADLCNSIAMQKIEKLQPVSRSVIINTSCIKDIHRQEKGRIEIHLINLPERSFIVGKKYESFFVEHFLAHRIR